MVAALAWGCEKPSRSAPPPAPLVERIDAGLTAAGAFLVAAQGQDGAVRSRTYAFFKDGYSLTPLTLMALRFMPEESVVRDAYGRGIRFLTTLVEADGSLRAPPNGPRYPLYSIALAILVLNPAENAAYVATRDALLPMLRGLQRAEDGGWGYEERTSNVSATIFAIGALTLGGVVASDPALVAARGFVERCQNVDGDGGFFFSPTEHDGNKAGAVDPEVAAPGGPYRYRYRSYGSATADGYRALTRLGVAADHSRMVAAGAWLEREFRADRNPGDFVAINEVRRASSYYYWMWSAAHALRALGKPVLATRAGEVRWAEALAEELLKRQRPDGSWVNGASEMREDDPLVATPFAVAALAIARSVVAGEYRSHAGAR